MMLLLAAALSCLDPSGHRLTLVKERGTPPITMWAPGPTMQWIIDHPGDWFDLELDADSSFIWPRGQVVVATFRDSSQSVCDQLVTMRNPDSPTIHLGRQNVVLDPSELWRGKSRHVKLYVRFPHVVGWPRAISVERR